MNQHAAWPRAYSGQLKNLKLAASPPAAHLTCVCDLMALPGMTHVLTATTACPCLPRTPPLTQIVSTHELLALADTLR